MSLIKKIPDLGQHFSLMSGSVFCLLSKIILQGTPGGGRCCGWQRKCWTDNIKGLRSLPMPDLLKPVLHWVNCEFVEFSLDNSTNYTLFLNCVSYGLSGHQTWFWWTILPFLIDLSMRCKFQPAVHDLLNVLYHSSMFQLNWIRT